ncbi:hypothetical protein KIL84_014023, partial [Mauremys mutica]
MWKYPKTYHSVGESTSDVQKSINMGSYQRKGFCQRTMMNSIGKNNTKIRTDPENTEESEEEETK